MFQSGVFGSTMTFYKEFYTHGHSVFKENLQSKKSLAQMKERKNAKRAVTDLNAPNGSRDIPFQIHKLEQYGRRHFVEF